jgi:hypothetical protein
MLVQSQAPSVFMHMMRHGVQPLKIAFPWLMFGFSGTLDVCEVMRRIASYTSHVTRHTTHVTRCIRCCSCGIALSRTTLCYLFQCLLLPCSCSGKRQSCHSFHVTSLVTRHFRSKAILDSSNADMINEVFEDLTRIRLKQIPVQFFLFAAGASHAEGSCR